MLIYNSQKEFIGIDKKDLMTFGFSSLSELLDISKEFADLFVKTPKHIHNFKHVHWIDYILCMDDDEEAKVIINLNTKNYECILTIDTAYLTNNPSEEAYLINLKIIDTIELDETIKTDEILTPTKELIIEEEQKEIPIVEKIDIDETIDITIDEPLDILIDDEPTVESEPIEMIETIKKTENIEAPIYRFDPKVASDELGLPIDLIEEFIEDFINQAKEFKKELYSSLNDGNLDKVQKLSHKLKGVAANLRIEDAKEILVVINTSNDLDEIKNNLDSLYTIIKKLANEETIKNDEIIEDTVDDDIFDDLLIPLENEIPQDSEDDYLIDSEIDKISYDKVIAANEIGLDEENFNQLFNDFKHETNILCNNIQTALENNDYKTWQQRAIELRSMSENMRLYDYDDALTTIIETTDSTKVQDSLDTIKSIMVKISN